MGFIPGFICSIKSVFRDLGILVCYASFFWRPRVSHLNLCRHICVGGSRTLIQVSFQTLYAGQRDAGPEQVPLLSEGLGTSGQLALQVLVDGPPMPPSVGLLLLCPRFWCWQVPPPLPQVGWVPTHCWCGWWGLPVSICGSEVDVPHRSLRICSYPDPLSEKKDRHVRTKF